MKKLWMLIWIAGFAITLAEAQSLTTFILVRHAEKVNDGSKNPALTDVGVKRAQSLAHFLKKTKIDAIYSTHFLRTESTVAPLAESKGLSIQNYDPAKMDFVDQLLVQHAGGTVVICGHSNTTPALANYLLGNSDLTNFEDQDYDNLLVVTLSEKGKGKLVWMSY